MLRATVLEGVKLSDSTMNSRKLCGRPKATPHTSIINRAKTSREQRGGRGRVEEEVEGMLKAGQALS